MMQNPSLKAGMISSPPVSCHELEAPDIPSKPVLNVPAKEAAKTHQVPKGEHSILHALRKGEVTAAETMLFLTLNFCSHWDTGKTHCLSTAALAKKMHVSKSYVHQLRQSLIEKGFVSYLKKGTNTGSRYQLTHHNCPDSEVPTERYGKPLKFAVPLCIFWKLFAGEISWKAALIWILKKTRSDFSTGLTYPINYKRIRELTGFSEETIGNCVAELTHAGLVERLSKRHEKGSYQLYPKPASPAKPPHKPKQRKTRDNPKTRYKVMKYDGGHYYSLNQLWRIHKDTGNIERRDKREKGLWQGVSDYDIATLMHPAIKHDFDKVLEAQAIVNKTRQTLWDTDSWK